MKIRNTTVWLRNAVTKLFTILLTFWNTTWRIKLLIFAGGGVVIVLITLLVTVWLVPRPELSSDTVRKIDKAKEVCSLAVDASDGSACSHEVWKTCHISRAFSEEQNELRTNKFKIHKIMKQNKRPVKGGICYKETSSRIYCIQRRIQSCSLKILFISAS